VNRLTDWDEILSADCPVGALPHLVCCVEATMVVDPRIPWEWERVFMKIQGCHGPPVSCGWVHLFLELIAHGSPLYTRETGFLKKAETFLTPWACVVQWLERRAQWSDDPCVGVRIPLWDVGAGLSDETVKTEAPCRSRCSTIKIPPCSKALSAEHRRKLAALSPVMVTAAR
jgi:hypothetical protein